LRQWQAWCAIGGVEELPAADGDETKTKTEKEEERKRERE
jgi:hypothetical protein